MDRMLIKILFLTFISLRLAESRFSTVEFRQLPTSPLTLTEWPSYNYHEPDGPGTYAFGYEIEDPATGNVQFRDEERLANGTVRGSYGHLRPDGVVTITKYVADSRGYRQTTETFKKHNTGTIASRPPPPPPPPIQTTIRPPPVTSVTDLPVNPSTFSPDLVQAIKDQHQIDLLPNNDPTGDVNILDPEVAAVINGQYPVTFVSQDGKDRVSLQLINNFIPTNFQLAPFLPPKRDEYYDPIETTTFVNDKFQDPIHNDKFFKRKNDERNAELIAQTKEALWYRDLIRGRRKEYLEKYNTDYDLYTIPPEYDNKFLR